MKCECPDYSNEHEMADCHATANYAVIRNGKIVFVCAECKMPEDKSTIRGMGRYYEDKEST